jgi:hypothetical protein
MGTKTCQWVTRHIWNVDAVTALISDELSEKHLGRKGAKGGLPGTARARPHDNVRVLSTRAGNVEGEPRILCEPLLMMPIEDLVASASARHEAEKSVCRLIQSSRSSWVEHHLIEEFRCVHMARKGVRRGQRRDPVGLAD